MATSTRTRKKPATAAEKRIKARWSQLPSAYLEKDLTPAFIYPLFVDLGIAPHLIKNDSSINQPGVSGLRPDLLIHKDLMAPPVLAVEVKKRVVELAERDDDDYIAYCKQHRLYRAAVGYPESGENGILQYLNVDTVRLECLASYGLVLNGDFFQLWRRVDGLVFPITTLQRITERSIIELCRQLQDCLNTKPPGLVMALWNRKGGVGKTTNTINISASLALRGKRVLLVDLDSQNDLTGGLGFQSVTSSYLEEIETPIVFNEEEKVREIIGVFIQEKTYSTTDGDKFTLKMLTANKQALVNFLNEDRFDDSGIVRPVFFERLFKLLKEDYDYIFVDASPSIDKLSTSLFAVCDIVLPSMDFDPETVRHTIDVKKHVIPNVRKSRKARNKLFVGPWNLDVIFSNAPSKLTNYDTKLVNQLISHGFDTQTTKKRIDNRIIAYRQTKSAKGQRMPVICWRDSPATKCYENFVESVFINHNYTDH